MMKNLNIFIAISALFLASCNPFVEDKSELGALPNPDFEIMAGDTPNDFVLVNTTDGAFLTDWDLGSAGSATGQEANAYFAFKGSYEITMTTFTQGGHASVSKNLEVTQDDPNACFGNFALLTGCTEKAWIFAPEANAMHIGPSLNETWWGNSDSDVIDRACHFNDRYIFKSNGEFEFDNVGDFWADEDGQGTVWPADLGLEIGCHDASEWPSQYNAWDSGIHAFTVNDNSLTLTGLGAYMGLYKAGTSGEVMEPQPSTTYSIAELTEDRLVIFCDYGWGVWRFTFVPE